VVVGSLAFLGFEGFAAVGAGVDVAGAGCAAGWLGLAPPVDAAGAAVATGVAGAADEDVVVGADAAVVVTFLGCAALRFLAWWALCTAIFGAAVVGVGVAAAGCALVCDCVEPPPPHPAAAAAAMARMQSAPRFMARLPFVGLGL
jgi:hypothetical protein